VLSNLFIHSCYSILFNRDCSWTLKPAQSSLIPLLRRWRWSVNDGLLAASMRVYASVLHCCLVHTVLYVITDIDFLIWWLLNIVVYIWVETRNRLACMQTVCHHASSTATFWHYFEVTVVQIGWQSEFWAENEVGAIKLGGFQCWVC